MTIFLLIRHGENDYLKQGRMPGHIPGIHLNERGREQANALAEHLKTLPIKAIYASPLERAVETAAPLAGALGLEIQIRPRLLELNIGEWQGQLHKELQKLPLWKEVQEQPSMVRFPGGESFLECQQRLVKDFNAIRRLHKQKDMVALVFHADPIKLALAHFIGLPLDHFQRLAISPGSVSVVMLGRSGAYLAGMNLSAPFGMGK